MKTKLNILIANTYHFRGGGDSTYTFNLADLLRRNGHEVAFFAMQSDRNISDPNSKFFVSNIDFNRINLSKNLLNGLRVISRVIYSRESRQKFRGLLKKINPDIIHIQSIHHHITPSIIFEAKKHGIPIVWTLHDFKLICPNTHFLIDKTGEVCEACSRLKYYQAILRRCKKDSLLASLIVSFEAYAHRIIGVRRLVNIFITPSIFLREKLIDRGFPRVKVIHLPFFLHENMFNKDNKIGNYFLFLGKLEPIKGIYQLIETFKTLPKLELILAGPIREPIKSQLPKLLSSNIKYVGMKKGDDLRRMISESRAIVLPSLCYENQPFSLLEAFAARKPVITSNIGGMSELVISSNGGILVPPGSIYHLKNAIKKIVDDEKEARKMCEAAFEYAQREHNVQKHYNQLMKIYEKVLN